jgi:hypothetical protein
LPEVLLLTCLVGRSRYLWVICVRCTKHVRLIHHPGSLDSYPQGFDCSNPTNWTGVITNYHSYHKSNIPVRFRYLEWSGFTSFPVTNPNQPFYFPEVCLSAPVDGHTYPYCQHSFKAALSTHGVRQHQVAPSLTFANHSLLFLLVDILLLFSGYDPCLQLTGPDFQSVFNLNLWAANAKLINYYMIYGYIYLEMQSQSRVDSPI